METILKTSSVIKRHPANPILSAHDVPYPTTRVFNAGVCKYHGKYVMIFRNDHGPEREQSPEGTNLGIAFSEDGIAWQVQPKPFLDWHDDEVIRAYDPRLTVIEDRCYICFAIDTQHGIRGVIAMTDDFNRVEILSMTLPDNRNIVLFPERMDGKYMRLERPLAVYGRWGMERFDIWISESPDLRYWGNSTLLLGVDDVPFANLKIGPAAPPIRTPKGWLATFHAVVWSPERTGDSDGYEESWDKRYSAGLALLDLDDPRKVIAVYAQPLIAPEAPYETTNGNHNAVVFPGGMILEDNGEVKIYYGAADTVECLATAQVDDLLSLCAQK